VPLPFEKPLDDLEARIRDMRAYAQEQHLDMGGEIAALESRLASLTRETFAGLNRWQRVQVARAPGRPTALDYIDGIVADFAELHGDRTLGDDPAVVGGLGRLGDHGLVVIVQQ